MCTVAFILGCNLPSIEACSKLPHDDRSHGESERPWTGGSVCPTGQPASRP